MFYSDSHQQVITFSRWLLLSLLLIPTLGYGQEKPLEFGGSDAQQLKNYFSVMNSYDLEPGAVAANDFLKRLFSDKDSQKEIANLITQLSSSEYLKREAAEKKLMTYGAKGIRLLAQVSVDSSTETRLRAKRCLAAIESSLPQVVEAAIQVLRMDPDTELGTRQRLDTLFNLCGALEGSHVDFVVADAILDLAEPKHSGVIAAGCKSANLLLRTACVRALPKCFIGPELRNFAGLLVDSDASVSLAAIESFGELQPDVSVKQLVNVLIRCESESIRSLSADLLRCLSNQYFGLDPIAAPATQEAILAKWDQWRREHGAFTKTRFLALRRMGPSVPIGFLVSTNGSKLTRFDSNGEKLWTLNVPVYDARQCSGGRILVTLRSANQVQLIDRNGATIRKVDGVNSPSDAELLQNNHMLILQGDGVVTERDIRGVEIQQLTGLSTPFDVDRLANGNTLVADAGNDRLVEFDPAGKVIWQKRGLAFPNNVFRMPDGRTLYTTYTSGLVGLLKPNGDKLWEVEIEDSMLYSVHYSSSRVYVADGRKRRIVILDMNGNPIREIQLDVNSFCDVSFVTRSIR